ncbi:MAG: response regulator [Polyangiaceae bacterium]
MRILVADDELTSRTALSAIVKKLGHTTVVVSDGAEGWRRYVEEPFGIVVTDWLMPELSGIELARRIRESHERGEHRPPAGYTWVLVVTSLSAREKCLEAFQQGVDDLLVKPIDQAQVTARLSAGQRVIAEHAATKEAAIRGSVAQLQSALGSDDPRLTESFDSLIELYRSQDAYAKARAFLRRQIDLIERSSKGEDPRLAKLKSELSELATRSDPVLAAHGNEGA